MSDEHMEERLRRAFRAQAGGIAPDEEASLDHIRHRARRVRTQRRATAAGICAVVLLVGLAVLPNLSNDDTGVETTPPAGRDEITTTTTTRTEATTTTTTAAAVSPTVPPPPVIVWPAPEMGQYTDPVEAARSFMEEYIGFADPTFGDLRRGEEGFAEIDVYRTGEDGSPLDAVASTIFLRQVDGNWVVVSARSEDVVVEQPADFDTIASPVVIDGRGRGFEGTVVVRVREAGMGAGEFLSEEPTIAGSGESLEPFHLELIFGSPSQSSGSLSFGTDSGGENSLSGFTVVPVLFAAAAGGGADTTQFDVFFVDADAEVVAWPMTVPRTRGVLRAALGALLAGPEEAGAEGLTSAFPASAAAVNFDVVITDGVAVVNFGSAPFGPEGLSATQSELVLRQLHATVFQFSSVERAAYLVGGECEPFWNPLQRDCMTVTPADPGI